MTKIERLFAYNTIQFYLENFCNCKEDLLDLLDDDLIQEIVFTILESSEMNEE